MTFKNTIPEIVKVSKEEIIIRGLSSKMSKIAEICHEQKHLYKEGYRCGRKTRKKIGEKTEKWEDCPEICFTYLLTDDFDENKKYKGHNGFLKIKILTSDRQSLLEKYSKVEIDDYAKQFAESIADEITMQIIVKMERPGTVKAAVTL